MFYWLLCEQTASASFWRNVAKGLIAFVMTYVPQLLDFWQLPEIVALGVMGALWVVLSPIFVKLGGVAEAEKFKHYMMYDADGNETPLYDYLKENPEQPFCGDSGKDE